MNTLNTSPLKTIAFVGLGAMGLEMAKNLTQAGMAVRGWDIVPAARKRAQDAGVSVPKDMAAVLDGADAVITMLPAGRDVAAVLEACLAFAPQGINKGALFIDSSTVAVAEARASAQACQAAGMRFIDAPVSGGVVGAAAGTLAFMAGGDKEAIAAAEPLFAIMGSRVVSCGEVGAGQAAKAANNMLLAISMIGASEAFNLGRALGLAPEALHQVLTSSSGQCWSVSAYCPEPGMVAAAPANNGYRPGFSTALMVKDLTLAQQAASASGAITPLGAQARQLYAQFAAAGGSDTDFSGIIRFLRGETPEGQHPKKPE